MRHSLEGRGSFFVMCLGEKVGTTRMVFQMTRTAKADTDFKNTGYTERSN